MTPPLLPLVMLLAAGSTLVLGEVSWFARRGTVARLRPYVRSAAAAPRAPTSILSQVVAPGILRIGDRLARRAGISASLQRRLELAGIDEPAASFRLRQVAHGVLAVLAAIGFVVAASPTALIGGAALLGAPTLTVLLHEGRVSTAIDERRDRLRRELPVVTEQLGMLLGVGYSLPSALTRLSERTDGVVAADLRRVGRRVRQGLTETAALVEWADRSDLDAVRRLVALLSLHGEAGDLASLVADEARALREEAHRDLLEDIERRAQLVWVPVTVATLVPGLIFLAVPFSAALSQVTGAP